MKDLIMIVIILLIALLPPAIYGYIYPSIGDDASVHVQWIESIQGTTIPQPAYWGQLIIGVPIKWISNITGASVLSVYVWTSYLIFALACIVLYAVSSRLVNRWAGLFAVATVVFASGSFMYLFGYGQIFNIASMCIILPVGVLFLSLWTKTGKMYLLAGTIATLLLFALFHPTGTYLPYCAGLYILLLIVWSSWNRKKEIVITSRLALRTAFALMMPVILATVLSSTALAQNDLSQIETEAISFPTFIISLYGLVPVALLLLALAVVVKNKLKISTEAGLAMGFLLATSVALAVASFIYHISPDPARQAFDLGIVLGLLTSLLMGVAFENWKEPVPVYNSSNTDNSDNAKPSKLVHIQLGSDTSRQEGD